MDSFLLDSEKLHWNLRVIAFLWFPMAVYFSICFRRIWWRDEKKWEITCANKFTRMFGLCFADESLGPPELADGGAFTHLTGSWSGGAVNPSATAGSTATPFVVLFFRRISRLDDASPMRRQRRTYYETGTIVMRTDATIILAAAHWVHRKMHPIGNFLHRVQRMHRVLHSECAILILIKKKWCLHFYWLFSLIPDLPTELRIYLYSVKWTKRD